MGSMSRAGIVARRQAPPSHLRAVAPPPALDFAVFASRPDAIGYAPDMSLADRARAIYDARRRRDEVLGTASAFFHDPAWDILLDLFVRGEEREIVSVSSACVGACVAPTTALRCLKAMERAGVVSFRHDPFDKRRHFVGLTVDTHRRIATWLAGA